MSDDNPTPEAKPKADDWKAPATQEELNAIVESRLARERAKYADYEDVKAKAAEFDKAQEKNMTEAQKAADRAAKAETQAVAEKLRADRAEIALVKGLTPTQAKRLVGSTREELEADAEELLKDLKGEGSKPPRAPNQKTSTSEPHDDPTREFARKLFGRSD